jgi:TP901 family phage tail tape measure protein
MSIRINVGATFDGKDLQRAQRELDALKANADTLSNRMSALGDKFQSVGGKVASVGSTFTRRMTLPIVGAGAAGVKTAADFESSMSKITGLVGIAADEVKGMESAVLDLSGRTAKSPQELADALFVITSAGLRGKDALNALESSAMAGAAGLGQTNDIARAVAGSLNAYGAETLNAAQSTDIIVAAARAGNFETSQFAGALGRVLPFAQQAGSSFEDMAGGVALLTRTNGDAAQSVTQMSALFRAFVVPTEQARTALSNIGLSAEDVRTAIAEDGLPAALEMLDDKLGGNREELGRLLGSSEAAAAAFQILDADAQTVADTFGVTNNAVGLTGDAFQTVSETSAFQFAQTMAQLKTLLIDVGAIIMPFVTDLVDGFGRVIETFKNLDEDQQRQIVMFLAIVAALGPVLFIVGKVAAAFGTLIKVGVTLAKGIAFLVTPMGLVVLAIAAVIAIGVLLWKNWDTITEKAAELWSKVSGWFKKIWDSIKETFDTVKEYLSDVLGSIGEAFGSAWDGIVGTVRSAANMIIGLVNAIIGAVERMVNALASGVNNIPRFTVPEWVPGIGGKSFGLPNVPRVNFPRIPALAEGGVVRQATLAVVGEAGPEVVIPLDRMNEFVAPMPERETSQTVINLNVSGAIDPEATARLIIKTLDDAQRRTGVRIAV